MLMGVDGSLELILSWCLYAEQDFELTRLLAGHDGYVNSLEFIPADEDCECTRLVESKMV